jgi:hypothetical protein
MITALMALMLGFVIGRTWTKLSVLMGYVRDGSPIG